MQRFSTRRRRWWVVGLTALGAIGPGSGNMALGAPEEKRAGRPNVVFILIDDMRWDVMSCVDHPFVKTPNIDGIAAAGVRFSNAFVTTSLCSPSRGSFLTGTYVHRHGVRLNGKMDLEPSLATFPMVLQRSGYETGFVGKWHMRPDAEPRPGFDYWLSFKGQGQYVDPPLNENGREFKATGYMTDLLTDDAVRFLEKPREKPFCLVLAHKAMHGPFIPAKRHKDLYGPGDVRKPASFDDPLTSKPKWQRELAVTGGRQRAERRDRPVEASLEPATWDPESDVEKGRLNWHRTLAAVDESVGRVLETLRKTGAAENTVVIFTSDNGFFLGEHRRGDKRMAYEESMRIPLLIAGAGVTGKGRVVDELVLNIDVAPTIEELAGAAVPDTVQGRSLKPLLAGQKPAWRESFLYEYFQEAWIPGIPMMQGIRTRDFKYVRYPELDDIGELYDLKKDPREMHNLFEEPGSQAKLEEMKAELERLLKETDVEGIENRKLRIEN